MAYINLGQVIYPIGAYYISNNGTSPSTLFGGTWTLVEAGTFICGANSTDWPSLYKGGHNWLTLTESQMPKHRHSLRPDEYPEYWSFGNDWAPTEASGWTGASNRTYPALEYFVGSAGGSQPFDNKPQYISAFIWYRTA